jgi:hypothetical protein
VRDQDQRCSPLAQPDGNESRRFRAGHLTQLKTPDFARLVFGNSSTNLIHLGLYGESTRCFSSSSRSPRRLQQLPVFVTVRGGGYFFLPGMRALDF